MIYNKEINGIEWPKVSLSKMTMEGNTIVINLESEDEICCKITCIGVIGVKHLGHWNSNFISSIRLEESGDTVIESLFKVKKYNDIPLNFYTSKDVFDKWYQLNIKIKDGSCLSIACRTICLDM